MEPRKRTKRRHSKQDFFERLPDDLIIRHILPRVGTMKTIARLSMVSRRFNRLCIWTPNVDFSDLRTKITKGIISYLDRFFDLRTKHSTELKYNVQRLNLKDLLPTNLTRRKMNKWIQQASSLDLEELFIERWPYLERDPFSLQWPSKLPFVQFPSKLLRILSLYKVDLDEKNVRFDDWLLNCGCLEELYLTNINFLNRELKINSSSLRVLSVLTDDSFKYFSTAPKLLHVSAPLLQKLKVVWELDGSERDETIRIRVSAPNLEDFSLLRGSTKRPAVLDYSSLESFQCLRSAAITFYKIDHVPLDSMLALLSDISQLKSLLVNIGFIHQCSLLGLPISLNKLEHLHIYFGISARYKRESSAKAITSFLKELPLLKTLNFTAYEGRREVYYALCYLRQNPNRDQLKFLKSLECDSSKFGISKLSVSTETNLAAEIQLCEGRRGEELALHIIRHAPKDSQVTISYPKQNS